MTRDDDATELAKPHVRELLLRRAERLRTPRTASQEDDAQLEWLATFSIGSERFGLPLPSLRAVVPLRLVTPVPLVPAHVIGILRFQGEIVTALSLVALLRGRAWRIDSRFLLVLETAPNGRVAVDCAEIPVAAALPTRLFATATLRDDGVREVTSEEHETIGILDVVGLLARLPSRGR